jgi:DNA polymerase-1
MPPALFLIDGHALAYRTYFALTRGTPGSFTTRSGEPTAGIYGFTAVLLKILEEPDLHYLAVAFDTGKTFRDEIFPEYKGTRAKMPDDLRTQIDRIRQLVDAFNLPRLEMEGYEADDILGSVARQAAQRGMHIKIYTGDRDLLQLVTDQIAVSLPGKSLSESKFYFPQDVKEFMGVRPDQIVDLKALTGDKSDNIPGVAGIGDKTAITLLETYDTLDGVYNHLSELSPALQKKLAAGKENAYLSRKLATIVTDLDLQLDYGKFLESSLSFDLNPVEAIFRELEFRSLRERLSVVAPRYTQKYPVKGGQQLSLFAAAVPAPENPVSELEVTIVDTPQALQNLAGVLEGATQIAFDTETTSTDQMRAQLVGISLAVNERSGYYIPVGHRTELGKQLPLQDVLDTLRPSLTNPRIGKVGHNVKYDYVVLARYGLQVSPLTFDTMIAEWLCTPTSRNLGLKNLVWVRLNKQMTEIDTLIGKGKNQILMSEVPIAAAADYAAADAVMVLRLIPQLQAELVQCSAQSLMRDIEMPLVPILADMEIAGICLDTQFLAEMSSELTSRMQELEMRIFEKVGKPFNLNSTQQLSDALFNILKLPPPDRTRRTASGHFSTSADVLEAMVDKSPVVEWVLEFRELAKLKSTYVDALPLQVNPATGRIHTSYNQTGSVTGRIASSDPNLQNIPIRTELGSKVRRAFVAAPEHVLLSVDYSQVELRIVAHMANDQAMLAAFQANQDIHATTASAIHNIPLESVSKDQRRHAKAINFGLIYGMSSFGLTRTTDMTLAESENYLNEYFRKFAGVKRFLEDTRLLAARQGYVETLLGRRRYFPGLVNEQNANVRNREEREAINAPVQGTAADIMKLAMLKLPAALVQAGLQARLLLQVHDELVLECPQAQLVPTAALVRQVMEDAYSLNAPLQTEARFGVNWGKMLSLED